jgi:tetratricopeptide (TPR) repeat protein
MVETLPTVETPQAKASAAAFEPGARFGRYVVLEQLGAGGMGVVLAAYDPQLDRRVAIKVLAPRAAQRATGEDRLLREAQAMARLTHPNVIAIHDVGAVAGRVFLAMEFVAGCTVREWLATERTWREVVGVFVDAGRGLAAAHDAGLIHRDFKPDNLLVADAGGVFVTDFGLAMAGDSVPEAAPSADEESGLHAFDTPLTRTGVLLGTPAYMAPEQHRAGAIDARADQFAFCASLYEGLYKKRPFPEDRARLIEAVSTGALAEPPKDSQVPSWLHRIVVRGLRPEPDDRFRSMRALLDELDREPRRRRRAWAAAVLAAIALGTGVAVYAGAGAGGDAVAVCSGTEDELRGTWDQASKQAVRDALLALPAPYAADTWQRVEQTLDAYAGAWIEMRHEACVAARVRGHQTERQLELRTVCLDGRRKHLHALAQLLSAADAAMAGKASQAAYALPSLEACADLEALSQVIAPPEDDGTRAAVDAIRTRLAEAKVMQETGRIQEALAVAQGVVEEARAIDYAPIQAEALFQLAFVEFSSGKSGAAESTLYDALDAAEASGHTLMAAESWSLLVFVVGNLAGRYDEAAAVARRAEAAVKRLGSPRELRARLDNALGAVAHRQARYREALDYYESAVDGYEAALGAAHPKLAMVLNNVGILRLKLGDSDAALAQHMRGLEIKQAALGSRHPSIAFSRLNISQTLNERPGREQEAVDAARAAIQIWQDTTGVDNPNGALGRSILGEALRRNGEHDAALVEHTQALDTLRSKLGEDSVHLAYPLTGIGKVRVSQGRYAQAIPPLERAVELREQHPADAWERADSRFALAQAMAGAGKPRKRVDAVVDEARDDYEAAGPRGQRGIAALDAWLTDEQGAKTANRR